MDAVDLVSLWGCSLTSQENYLTNFVIEGYLELIAHESEIERRKVEFIGCTGAL